MIEGAEQLDREDFDQHIGVRPIPERLHVDEQHLGAEVRLLLLELPQKR